MNAWINARAVISTERMGITVNTDHGRIAPYAVMILTAFALGLCGLIWLSVRRGIPKRTVLYLPAVCPVLSILLGFGLTFLTSGFREVGLSSLGGLAGMYAGAGLTALASRQRGYAVVLMQNCTLMLPLMYAAAKIGCYLAGCCGGIPYDGPLHTVYTGAHANPVAAFPVQLAETAVFLCIFAAGLTAFLRYRKNSVPAVFLASAGAKFGLDFLRISHQGQLLSVTQLLCLALIAGECVLLARRQRRIRNRQLR